MRGSHVLSPLPAPAPVPAPAPASRPAARPRAAHRGRWSAGDPDTVLAAAHDLADVAWLAGPRRAHHAWPLRLGALGLGVVLLGSVLAGTRGTPWLWLAAAVGAGLCATGLLLGARYGRIVAGLAAAIEVGCTPTWLTHRIAAQEGHPTALAVELEQLVEERLERPGSRW